VSLEGATLRPDQDANEEMYGKKMSNHDVVMGDVAAPAGSAKLLAELNKYSSRRG
jgi:lipid-binding SYLF domain-containing protein